MKLKTLTIIVAILTIASVLTWSLGGRRNAPETDPRVGTKFIDQQTIEKTAEVLIRANGNEVTLKNTDPSGSAWIVRQYHDLPIDFNKLATLVRDLGDAEVLRFASANPDRIATMDFGDSVIELHDADGATLFSAKLGRSITGGGRFVQFNNEEKAYLVSLSSWLDTTAKNWADTALVPAKAEDVTRFEIGFDSDEPLVVTRTSSSDPWTAEGLPDGGALNSDAVAKLVNQLAGLRFTETIAVDSPDVDVAREHVRKFVLQTAEGTSYNIQIGQVPPPPPPPATEEPEPDSGEAKPKPEPKPGPVFVFVQSPEAGSEFNERMSRVGYQINEWTYKGMPDNRSAFITIAPPAPTPQPAVTPPDSLPAPTMPTSTPPTPEAEAAGEVETGTTSE